MTLAKGYNIRAFKGGDHCDVPERFLLFSIGRDINSLDE